MTTNHRKPHRPASAMIVLLVLVTSASGQRLTHHSGIPVARGPAVRPVHPPVPCQGRCQYCVDGQCIPRQETFGFYETQWRRWPIEASAVVAKPHRKPAAKPELGPAAEVPAPHSESDVNPEFPHLRRSRTNGAVPMPPASPLPLPAGKPTPAVDPDNPFRDDLGYLPSAAPASPTVIPRARSASTGSKLRSVVPADYSQNLADRPAMPGKLGSSGSVPIGTTGDGSDRNIANPLRLAPPRISSPVVRPTTAPVPLPKPDASTPNRRPANANPLRSR